MSGYQKPCIFCKQEIRLSNDTGKWLPYNLDGTNHECKKSNEQPQPEAPKQQSQSQIKVTLSLESLDQKIKKLEETFDLRVKKIEALLFDGEK